MVVMHSAGCHGKIQTLLMTKQLLDKVKTNYSKDKKKKGKISASVPIYTSALIATHCQGPSVSSKRSHPTKVAGITADVSVSSVGLAWLGCWRPPI